MFSNSNKNKLLSSLRLSNSLNDLKRKSIVKKINKERENSVYNYSQNPTNNYLKNSEYIIVPDNELILRGDKKCKEYDIYNENLYRKNNKLYHDICQKIEGSILELKSQPSPLPIPNNYERLILYRQRNQPVNVLQQTCAIIYLLQHNYLLVDDLSKVKSEEIKVSDKTVFFEAYQAIGLASELSHIKGEDFTKIQFGFTDINLKINNSLSELNLKVDQVGYPSQNNPLVTGQRIRTLSENIINDSSSTDTNNLFIRERSKSIVSTYPNNNDIQSPFSTYPSLDLNEDVSASAPDLHSIIKHNSHPLPQVIKVDEHNNQHSELKCDCPEHHSINDKVTHFNTLICKNK